jgi:hypothetical protein
MLTSRFLVVTVALLLFSAGCLGGGGVPDAGGADGASDGADADTQSGDADTNAGDGQSGADDLELSDAEQALRDAGSFTATWTYRGVDERGVEAEVRYEFYVDTVGERSLTVLSSARDGQPDGGSMQQFVADGTTYVQSGPADAPTYFSSEQPMSDPLATAVGFSQARVYESDDDLSFAGTETFDGVPVDRYELSEVDSQLVQAGSAAGVATGSGEARITDFHYTVLVDADGIARYESWSFEGETTDGEVISGQWEYSLTKVGSTTVDDPEWLAAAQAAPGS